MTRILLIEDDSEIVRYLCSLLLKEDFSVLPSRTRKQAAEALEKEAFDLVLLDLTLPDGNGYSLCTAIKRLTDTPVIFLTAADDEDSIVTAFDLGADDYISKPFKPMVLISRIRNVLRRAGKSPSVFRLAGLEIDTRKALVSKNGREIPLTALEYRLLLIFLNHPGEVLSRNRLLEEIWDIAGDYVNDNTLTVYIKRLRDKLEDNPAAPSIIKTVRGLGYKAGD